MKKMILMTALLISMTGMAQKAVMTFDKMVHDFGKINEADGRVTTIFDFKNEGDAPLVLTNVRASCGCTTPKWTREPIEPGKSGQITVTYNPNGRPGVFQKTITITSNASSEPLRLTIKGQVIPKPAQPTEQYSAKIGELSLEKKMINFGDVMIGQNKMLEMTYANKTTSPIKVEIASVSNACFKPLVTLKEVAPEQTGKIQVALQSADSKVYGPIEGKLYLIINGNEEDKNPITLKANIKEDFSKMTAEEVQLAPIVEVVTVVNAGTAKAGKALKTKIGIKNAGINTLLIRRIYSNSPEIVLVPVKNVKSGKMEDLSLTINTTGMSAAQYSREVTIITNDPKRSVVKVKVNWVVE
jgi:hypothetical protein